MKKKAELELQKSDSAKVIETAMEILRACSEGETESRLHITAIAKKCRISRAWIYKNFGSTSEDIVSNAIDVIAPMLVAPRSPTGQWQTLSGLDWIKAYMESFVTSLEQVELYPFLFKLYFKHRALNSKIGKRLAYHEERYSSQIVRLQVESSENSQAFEKTKLISDYLVAMRSGLIFKLLSSPEVSLTAKRQELEAVTKEIMDRLK